MAAIVDEIFVWGFVALAATFLMVVVALPTYIAYGMYLWLAKKNLKYAGAMLLAAAQIWTIYEIYTAIYPTESFYLSEFKTVTLRDAPESAIIIRKAAGYPDFHGDYCSASLITVSEKDYKKLLKELKTDQRISESKTSDFPGSHELSNVMGDLKSEQVLYSFKRNIQGQEDQYLYIGLLADKKSIVVSVCMT